MTKTEKDEAIERTAKVLEDAQREAADLLGEISDDRDFMGFLGNAGRRFASDCDAREIGRRITETVTKWRTAGDEWLRAMTATVHA